MATRQELERQLVAAHRSGNVQAAQQAAYAIRQYDQNALSAQVPQVMAPPPPIERVPQPTFGSRFEGFSRGVGRGITSQLQGIEQMVTQPVETAKALYGAAEAAIRNPSQALGELFAYGKRTVQQATSGPEGFGQVLGENMRLVPGGRRTPTQAELDVYHGTPHTLPPEEGAPLGRFRSEKIGTGEGAQAYGYGLYFAESPDVAEGYAWNLGQRAGNPATVNNVPLTDFYARIQSRADRLPTEKAALEYQKLDLLERLMQEQTTPAKVLANAAEQEGWNPAAIEWFKKEVAPKYKGHGTLYKVDLPDAKIEQMLDWDKPLSEQPEAVRKAIDSLGITPESLGRVAADKVRKLAQADGLADWARRDLLADADRLESAKSIKQISGTLKRMPLDYGINRDSGPFASLAGDFLALVKATDYVPNMDTGGGAYGLLSALRGGDAAASDFLRQQGIPGIKYLDAGSRDGGKGTRNFVVFPGEEQNLTILERK